MKEKGEEKKEQKKRVRSPNYPALTLERSLELARILCEQHHQYLVALEVAAKAWDITAPTGTYMARHVAALASYGLIDTEGEKDKRKIKVSDLGFRILADKRPDSPDREALIRKAALNPEMFKKMYNAFPTGLPSDDALDFELKTTYKFNPISVPDFIGIFRKTMDFAKVYKSDIIGSESPSMEEPNMITDTDKPQTKDKLPPSTSSQAINPGERMIGFHAGQNLTIRVLVSGEGDVTKESIEKLIKHLKIDFDIENDDGKS